MTLKQKVQKAVSDMRNNGGRDLTAYEDDYDGFTHHTYEGLVDEVIDALFDAGHKDSVSQSIIEDFVFDLA